MVKIFSGRMTTTGGISELAHMTAGEGVMFEWSVSQTKLRHKNSENVISFVSCCFVLKR